MNFIKMEIGQEREEDEAGYISVLKPHMQASASDDYSYEDISEVTQTNLIPASIDYAEDD